MVGTLLDVAVEKAPPPKYFETTIKTEKTMGEMFFSVHHIMHTVLKLNSLTDHHYPETQDMLDTLSTCLIKLMRERKHFLSSELKLLF